MFRYGLGKNWSKEKFEAAVSMTVALGLQLYFIYENDLMGAPNK